MDILVSYFTPHSDLFQNLDKVFRVPTKNLQFSFSGPVKPLDNLYFFVTGRYYENNGYLYGKRIYNITDIAPIQLPNGELYSDCTPVMVIIFQ